MNSSIIIISGYLSLILLSTLFAKISVDSRMTFLKLNVVEFIASHVQTALAFILVKLDKLPSGLNDINTLGHYTAY